ncbi:MAG: TVP38/TMEM64 family protein, partial [Aequorivita vladivostokensis]|nr:TVP38/TMEM64 family protein [Aequorivita vladivostokensis]
MQQKDVADLSVKKSKAPLYASVAILAVLVFSYFAIPQVNQFLNEAWQVLTSNDETRIKNWVSDFGWM